MVLNEENPLTSEMRFLG